MAQFTEQKIIEQLLIDNLHNLAQIEALKATFLAYINGKEGAATADAVKVLIASSYQDYLVSFFESQEIYKKLNEEYLQHLKRQLGL